MSTYLKTDNDKISYVRLLYHMMNADRKAQKSEMEYIYTMLYVHKISEPLFYEAKDLYEEHGVKGSEFSSAEAAIQAVVDAAELMTCDLRLAVREIARLFSVVDKLGILLNKEIENTVSNYINVRLESAKKLESLLNKVLDEPVKFNDYGTALPSKKDRLSFVRLLIYVAASDNDINEDEIRAIRILAKLYEIDNDTVIEACDAYKAAPDELPEFEDKKSFALAFKEAVKTASRDNNLAEGEKDAIKKMVKGYNIAWGEGYVSIVLDAVLNLINCSDAKRLCMNTWINECK